MAAAGRMHHDMGGRDAGSVDQGGHSHPEWEKRVDALMMLLSNSKRRVIGVDELRRGIEELGAENYSPPFRLPPKLDFSATIWNFLKKLSI